MMLVLKKLNIDKSRDQEGYANKTFKEGVAGNDLLEALLKIMKMIIINKSIKV